MAKKKKKYATQTSNCVQCFKPAVAWSGYVLRNGKKIIAGWCNSGGKGVNRGKCPNEGFSGHYKKEMGREKDKSP